MTARKALLHPWLSVATNDINLISTNRPNFPARAMFRKAVNVVQGINRLQKGVHNGENIEHEDADEIEDSKGSDVTEESTSPKLELEEGKSEITIETPVVSGSDSCESEASSKK